MKIINSYRQPSHRTPLIHWLEANPTERVLIVINNHEKSRLKKKYKKLSHCFYTVTEALEGDIGKKYEVAIDNLDLVLPAIFNHVIDRVVVYHKNIKTL